MTTQELIRFFEQLVSKGQAPLGKLDRDRLLATGVCIEGELATLSTDTELLDRSEIVRGLDEATRRWLVSMDIKPATGSTNSDLMASPKATIDGRVILAETQLSGRGRRGRTWISPFARNIALTVGCRVERTGEELGGFSLVVGLAVLRALQRLGIEQLALKWPNDVLYQGRKLCGVLIEMDHSSRQGEAVIGIGINHSGAQLVRAQVDQGLAELVESENPPSRNSVVAAVLSSLRDHVARFDAEGLETLKDEFSERHYFAGRQVRVSGAGKALIGRVLGVSRLGELHLSTPHGEEFLSGGEISMRELHSHD